MKVKKKEWDLREPGTVVSKLNKVETLFIKAKDQNAFSLFSHIFLISFT